jgi:WD40 repeat protein/putative metal-binding protein
VRIRPLLAGAVATLLLGAGPAWAAYPGTNGRIAYQGYQSLGTINATGGDRTPLVAESGIVFGSPSWSPDGQRLAFTTNRDGNFEIYVTGASGTPLTRVTNSPTDEFSPTWSPDGTKIAFERDDANAVAQILVMNADGSGVTNLSPSLTDDRNPAWSPDGSRIAFARGAPDNHDIFVMPATGGAGTPLTSGAANDTNPDWSPDSAQIVYQSNSTLVVMTAGGANPNPLPLPNGGLRPAWSPDGTKIVFDVSPELYSVNPDGSGLTPLTSGGSTTLLSQSPTWQPIPASPSPGGSAPPPPGPVDGDGDGVPAPADCNDADPKIRPGVRDRPGDKIDQNCDSRDARFRVGPWSVEAFTATYPSGYTVFTSMNVTRVKRGDRMRLACKGRGCDFKQKSIRVRKAARKLSLLRHLKGMKLRKGAVIELRVTRRDAIGKVLRWQIRAPKIPKITRSCLRPGAKKLSRCPN